MKVQLSSTPSRVHVRFSLAFVMVLMIISSPIVMLVSPTLVAASSSPQTTDPTSFSVPSTTAEDGGGGSDFTTQAALSSLTARPTNNIVNTNSFYDVVFLTATSGAIRTIQVTFPAGTTIPAGAFFNEAEGIGPGTVSKSGQTITYTVTNAVNVPAGTKIRLEFANINNPLNPNANYKVTVTTRNAANAIIDGPTESTAYTMKQIGSNAIANNAITTPKLADSSITSTKPAESYEKRVAVSDTVAGHAVGWDPNGVTVTFAILEPAVSGVNTSFVSVIVDDAAGTTNYFCNTVQHGIDLFVITCASPPPDGSFLDYMVMNVPPHLIS